MWLRTSEDIKTLRPNRKHCEKCNSGPPKRTTSHFYDPRSTKLRGTLLSREGMHVSIYFCLSYYQRLAYFMSKISVLLSNSYYTACFFVEIGLTAVRTTSVTKVETTDVTTKDDTTNDATTKEDSATKAVLDHIDGDDDKNSQTQLIIGLSLGGFFLLLFIIGNFIFIIFSYV